jgi:hydrogenase maturation factor HypF (carbamoyltransferase family)
VQGVGFRQFVYRIARLAGVHGHVLNPSKGVEIEAEDEESAIDQFLRALQQDLLPLAHMGQLTVSEMEPRGEDTFVIRESDRRHATRLSATCPMIRRQTTMDPGSETLSLPLPLFRDIPARRIAVVVESYRRAFPSDLADVVVDACLLIRQSEGLNRVCLSGGFFQNPRLLNQAMKGLHRVPANDVGLSLGQAVIANQVLISQ